ncbi:MAG TPA: 4Fe-4S binding protein [Alphaproteobacteria bacterium]|nr:4Fe-4S binding protein [Alphaproteobacteria bacterium]
MATVGKKLLICNCEGTMPLDGRALAKACRSEGALVPHRQLCRAELGQYEQALSGGEALIVACTQEAPLFEETREALKCEQPVAYVNIRERAGWSDEGAKAAPKIAALLAEAALEVEGTPALSLTSEGTLLIYGRDEAALEAARQLKGRLDVTVLLSEPAAVTPPLVTEFPLFKGTIVAAKGHLGAFEIVVDDYAAAAPSSRAALSFEVGRDGAASRCDLILDLSGLSPLFPSHRKRDGYFRPDTANPAAVQKALFELADMTGEFDKPVYIAFRADLCAHSRSRKTGCTRCLDVCPASAITSAGDVVSIDPHLCGGCGGCASVCPTGAASYALPPREKLLERLGTLLSTYLAAGGETPVLLLHDCGHGEEMVAALARFGRGLPAHVIPMALNEVSQIGFDFLAAAFAYGAAQVLLLVDPKRAEERSNLPGQLGLAEALLTGLGFGSGRLELIDAADPDAVAAALWRSPTPAPPKAGSFLPLGGKRAITMLALRHLHEVAPAPVEILPLPPGASFGRVRIAAEGCTLCLACVSACPTAALLDNPDKPQLSFVEQACIQCGLCKVTCPEKVITLEPRLAFGEAARGAVVLKEEEPFLCVRCGRPFATRSTIEKVMGRLAGSHWMYQDEARIERMKMCEDCRVIDAFESETPPLATRPRARTRTTEDYLKEREIEAKRKELRAEWEAKRKEAGDKPGGPGKG